jgi:CrcB protein
VTAANNGDPGQLPSTRPDEPRNPDGDLHIPTQRRELAGHEVDVLGAIVVGGLIGAEARHGLLVPHATTGWPTATFLINATGCFLIGVLMVVISELTEAHRLVRPLLGLGVLGGYTTFSTYTADVVQPMAAGRAGTALLYLVLTPLVALLAVWAGVALTPAAGAAHQNVATRRHGMSLRYRLAKQLTVIVGESDMFQHTALAIEIVNRAHGVGMPGVSMFRGIEGYVSCRGIRTNRFLTCPTTYQ